MGQNKENAAELEELRKQIGVLRAQNFSLEKDKALVGAQVDHLREENAKMQGRIASLERTLKRPKLSPEDLTGSLRNALEKMQEGLVLPGGGVGYSVGQFDLEIKAHLSVNGNHNLLVELPYLGEAVAAENLSLIKLSLRATPKGLESLILVPQLIGIGREEATKKLGDLGLKAGIQERPSPSAVGLVIDQKPEAYTEVPPDSTVVLVVAIPEKLRVPDLLNMDKDVALKVLTNSGFAIGRIDAVPAEAKPNTVVGQTPVPNTEAERGSKVDLTISATR